MAKSKLPYPKKYEIIEDAFQDCLGSYPRVWCDDLDQPAFILSEDVDEEQTFTLRDLLTEMERSEEWLPTFWCKFLGIPPDSTYGDAVRKIYEHLDLA